MTKQEQYELMLDYIVKYYGGYCDMDIIFDECWCEQDKFEIEYTMDGNVSYAVIKYKEVK
jgi:hypothetical protein